MKKLIISLIAFFLVVILAGCIVEETKKEVYYPEPTGYVVDTANVLNEETEREVSALLEDFDSVAQVAVVTVKTTQPLSIEGYSIKLAEKWKVGYEGKDNGVIFLIATEDRKARIEIGRGLEDEITDSKAGQILDTAVVPHLKNNDWDNGVLTGVGAIVEEVTK